MKGTNYKTTDSSSNRPLTIAITGSHGFIGQQLNAFLQKQNHTTIAIDRSLLYGSISSLQDKIANCDVVINLAGASINQRWTAKNKSLIYTSRITTTQQLVSAINGLDSEQQPKHFLSVSAIGLYQNELKHNEDSTKLNPGFLGQVVNDWENEMAKISPHIQSTIFRLGLVLGKNSKIISQLKPLYKLGLGGKIGTGQQAFPFVHINDVCRAFAWAIDKQQSGTFNLCTNEQINNKAFNTAFAKAVHRPAFFTIPAFMMRVAFGEMADLMLKSPSIDASKITKHGFHFSIQSIQDALAASL